MSEKELENVNVEEFLTTLPATLPVWLRNSQALFQALPPKPDDFVTGWKVTRLGQPAKKKEKETPPTIASILAAGRKPFCVGFRGNSKGEAAYYLGVSGDSEGACTRSLLQAAFGMAEVAPLEEKSLRYHRWGSCRRVYFSDEQLKQLPKPSEMTESWVDALARSAFNKDCQICLKFSPLDPKWLDGELEKAAARLDEMTRYQESSVQISSSDGFSVNKNGNIVVRMVDVFRASEKENHSDNSSTSISQKQEHWAIKSACEELQFRIRELKQLKRDGGWSLCLCVGADQMEDLPLLEQVLGSVFVRMGYQCAWNRNGENCAMILSGSQLSQLVHHPSDTFPGMEMKRLHSFAANLPETDGPRLKAGYMIWNQQEIENTDKEYRQPMVEIPLKHFNRHAFICGKTGSGKTNSVCSLVSSLGDIPFMVIEPVKGEYRSLKKIIPELQVYNFELHGENQLHMNPFWFPQKGKLSYHIDSLKSIIAASFDLEAAMPDILMQCLVSAYVKKGWNISTNQNVYKDKLPDKMLYPTFTTLCEEVDQYLETAGFGAELKANYKGAMLSRLQSYTTGTKGLLLDCSAQPPIEDWIRNKTSCVIELDELADDSDKAIIMGALLTQYFQCVKHEGDHTKQELKHVIVLEEAHHLFKETASSQSSGPNNRQHLVEMLSNMLAEIRAYGEGIFIVDQSPTSVSPQVIKNTAVKLVHHTDYMEDLKVLQDSLLLDTDDQSAPASLECGHALLRFGSMIRPVHLRVPLCDTKEEMGIQPGKGGTADDAQNLLDMLRMNRISRNDLRLKCRMFVNHFLLDSLEKRDIALEELQKYVISEAVGLGYDIETLGCISEAGWETILRKLIVESLPGMYPNQYLLCGRIQMAVERYLHLLWLQPEGLSPMENHLIGQYVGIEILPALRDYYRYSKDPKLRIIVDSFAASWKEAMLPMSGVLLNMVCSIEQTRRLQGEDFDAKAIFARPADEMLPLMCEKAFLVKIDPTVRSRLWQFIGNCWYAIYPQTPK